MTDRSLVRYTRHARLQMEERGIAEEDVLLTLYEPDEVVQGSHYNELIAVRRVGRRRVRVIYVSEPAEIRVITVTH